jgi:hypothetical protein
MKGGFMPATIRIVNMREKNLKGEVVNTTSKAKGKWQTDLSPFELGPCDLYSHNGKMITARNMENAWQYAKVYKSFTNSSGDPDAAYWGWAMAGWADPKPRRYPIKRGARPEYSWWEGERLGYIDARKRIYAPLFAEAVQKTAGWKHLETLYKTKSLITLRDYDGYDYTAMGRTLTQVLNDPRKIMGHAFVLAMLLLEDVALEEIALR